MSVSLINSGADTSGLTASAGGGFVASAGKLVPSNAYAAPSAVSVGAAVGGAGAGCAIWGKPSGLSTGITSRLYVGLQTKNDYTTNHYYGQIVYTAPHLKDYVEIHKVISTVDTLLTPSANRFSDTTNKRIYFPRGKLTTSDSVGLRWVDNEIQLWHIMADGKGFYLGKVVDSSITTPGFCGLYLGTNASGSWDDVYSGDIPLKWVNGSSTTGSSAAGSDAAAGTKAAPYRELRKGLGSVAAGGQIFARTGTYGRVVQGQDSLSMVKGTDWYNPTVLQGYNSEVANLNYSGSSNSIGFEGAQGGLTDAYIYIIGLKIDGQGTTTGALVYFNARASRIRIQECEVTRTTSTGGVSSSYHNDAQAGELADYDTHIIDCNIHHCGDTILSDHGAYLHRSKEVIEFNHIHENFAYGIQIQPFPLAATPTNYAVGTIIRNNRIWGNGNVGGSAGGIVISYAINTEIYNNLIHDNEGIGILVSGNSTYGNCPDGTLIYNNVIAYNASGIRHGTGSGTTAGRTMCINTLIWNNVLLGNTTNPIIWDATRGAQDNGSNGTLNFESNNLLTDPGFTNPATGDETADFSLSTGSGPAYDTGVNVTYLVKWDYLSYPTEGQNMEIGAYAWVEAAPASPGSPILGAPGTFTAIVNTETPFGPGFNVTQEVEDGPYSARIVVSGGTVRTGV